jgi:AcrR family transcriptional regulator
MPRDATDTRARLLGEAERLFAERGIHGATTREITAAAGQRNASALTYHFGSRQQVLLEILRTHGDPLDDQRGELVTEPVAGQTTRDLVAALLVPYASCLGSSSGRAYLRIVAQLADTFPVWRSAAGLRSVHMVRILEALEARVPGDEQQARERVVAMILLMTAAMAERARRVEAGGPAGLSHDSFVAMLADLIVAGLEAPVGPVLQAQAQAQPASGSSMLTSRRA